MLQRCFDLPSTCSAFWLLLEISFRSVSSTQLNMWKDFEKLYVGFLRNLRTEKQKLKTTTLWNVWNLRSILANLLPCVCVRARVIRVRMEGSFLNASVCSTWSASHRWLGYGYGVLACVCIHTTVRLIRMRSCKSQCFCSARYSALWARRFKAFTITNQNEIATLACDAARMALHCGGSF